MADALIGHTGFVGGNLLRQRDFDELFNSKNVEEIRGRDYDLLVCSAMPAAKWLANMDPEGDLGALDRLRSALETVSARRVVVVSTVDVYPTPSGVDEATPIDPERGHPYGRHRLLLEAFARGRFPSTTVVRLPGLFGEGLKKNAIYDLIHDHEVEKLNGASVYQFYDLDRLWDDVSTAMSRGLGLVNFATAPLELGEVAASVFGVRLARHPASSAHYDVRSREAHHFGGESGYLAGRDRVLEELRDFVGRARARGLGV